MFDKVWIQFCDGYDHHECVIPQFLYPGNWFPERKETLASDKATLADFIIITQQQIISSFKFNFISDIFAQCPVLSNHFYSHVGDLWRMCWDHANLDYSLALIMNGKTRWNIANH